MKVIAASSTEEAVRSLYYTLCAKFKLTDDDITLHISHTSCINVVNPNVFQTKEELSLVESYCDGFIQGFDEGIKL